MVLTHGIGIVIRIVRLRTDAPVNGATRPRVAQNTRMINERLCARVRSEVQLNEDALHVGEVSLKGV